MPNAKDIIIEPVLSHAAHAFVRRYHYSHKSVNNSQLHLGVFLRGQCVGVMQFGPPLDRAKLVGLVAGTRWNGFLELNRMAMVDDTPRNTESRALAVAMRLIRREYPHIQWIVSFADATQCGDGTIYRAAGFVLTSIKKNNQIWQAPDGLIISRVSVTKAGNILETGGASMKVFVKAGFHPLPGFQLRYVYFLEPTARERLTVPIIPFGRIKELGAGMYRGRAKDSIEPPAVHAGKGGVTPTRTLQFSIRERLKKLNMAGMGLTPRLVNAH